MSPALCSLDWEHLTASVSLSHCVTCIAVIMPWSLITAKADAIMKFPFILMFWDLLKWCNVLLMWSVLPQCVCESASLDLHEFIHKRIKKCSYFWDGWQTVLIAISIHLWFMTFLSLFCFSFHLRHLSFENKTSL